MLFRYKITKWYDRIGGMYFIHYNTKIQKYNPNNSIFKWETCKDTTLKSIVELLSNEYVLSDFENGLQEIADTISKYGSVDKVISEYIWKIIIKDMQLEEHMDNVENSLDDLVLTNGWKTIEFKENE